jgi:hypothetical protein
VKNQDVISATIISSANKISDKNEQESLSWPSRPVKARLERPVKKARQEGPVKKARQEGPVKKAPSRRPVKKARQEGPSRRARQEGPSRRARQEGPVKKAEGPLSWELAPCTSISAVNRAFTRSWRPHLSTRAASKARQQARCHNLRQRAHMLPVI